VRRYTVEVGGRVRVLDVDELAADRFRVVVDGQELEVRLRRAEDVAEAVISPEIVPHVAAEAFRPRPAASLPELRSTAPPPLAPPPEHPGDSTTEVRAPMPGSIVGVRVQPGDRVGRGQVLVELEAMKMLNPVRSPRDGAIAEVRVKAGETVGFGHVLVTFADGAP
jgi:biotin carboxyl carrier protein